MAIGTVKPQNVRFWPIADTPTVPPSAAYIGYAQPRVRALRVAAYDPNTDCGCSAFDGADTV